MRKPPPALTLDVDIAARPFDEALNALLAADYPWLDYLEPFAIEWEFIWPM